MTLVQDKKNAHNHITLNARGFQECVDVIDKCRHIDLASINVYALPLPYSWAMKSMFGIDMSESDSIKINLCQKVINSDTQKLITFLQNDQNKFTLIQYSKLDQLNVIYNDRNPLDLNNNQVQSIDDKLNFYHQTFFKTTEQNFPMNVWDQREQLALTLNTEWVQDSFDHMIDRSLPNLQYTTDDIWNDLPNLMPELLDYYELPLCPERVVSWRQAYYVWREKHDNHFSRWFDQIIDAIVNNHYMCLTRFNLNFYKEILIQHALITRHNLNLKTWKLEHFPSNTQDLYQLLEPNIHTLRTS